MFGSVTFYEGVVPTREFDGSEYYAMRPLVEALGLAWKPQFVTIKRRYSHSARVLPFQMPSGRYRRMLGLQIAEVNDWAYSINLKKVCSPKAVQGLLQFRDDLEIESAIRSEQIMIETRVQRLGEQYRRYPLTPEEQKLLADLRPTGQPLHPFTTFLAYGHILSHVRNRFIQKTRRYVWFVTIFRFLICDHMLKKFVSPTGSSRSGHVPDWGWAGASPRASCSPFQRLLPSMQNIRSSPTLS